MKIRSITTFLNPGWPLNADLIKNAGRMSAAARLAYEAGDFEVQTTRLATIPFPDLLGDSPSSEIVQFATALETTAGEFGFEYISIGPANPGSLENYTVLPEIFSATENTFAAGILADRQTGISLPAVRACAQVIKQCAALDPDGFTNLYFAALANVPGGSPFFPAAYHTGGDPTFAIAAEAADLAVAAFSSANTLDEARQNLTRAINSHGERLNRIGRELEKRYHIRFRGIDFTLAPFPTQGQSIGTALERLGVPRLGAFGSTAAAGFLVSCLEEAEFDKAGFNGLMLPVLEDSVLAARAAGGELTLKDLLLYSTVCGTGLDTIPLSGDVSAEQLAAVLLDLAVLSLRLDKPLTARLMPLPGKTAGDPVEFDFPFFANSRVMRLDTPPLSGLWTGDEVFHLPKAG